MKALIYTLVAIVFFTLGYTIRHRYQQKSTVVRPKIYTEVKIDTLNIDLGALYMKDSVSRHFVVKNIGKNPLLIKLIETDCGCTIVNWNEKPVLPEQSSDIGICFIPLEPGYFSKKISIFCNDKRSPFYIRLKGLVLEHK